MVEDALARIMSMGEYRIMELFYISLSFSRLHRNHHHHYYYAITPRDASLYQRILTIREILQSQYARFSISSNSSQCQRYTLQRRRSRTYYPIYTDEFCTYKCLPFVFTQVIRRFLYIPVPCTYTPKDRAIYYTLRFFIIISLVYLFVFLIFMYIT